MARTGQALLALALFVALTAGAYVTGAMVGPPPRAEDPPAGTTSQGTPSEAPEAARTPEPESSPATTEVTRVSVQQAVLPSRRPQEQQPRSRRPDPAADDTPATRDPADRHADDAAPPGRGWAIRVRPGKIPGWAGRGPDRGGVTEPHRSGMSAAAALTAEAGERSRRGNPAKPAKPANAAKAPRPTGSAEDSDTDDLAASTSEVDDPEPDADLDAGE